MLQYACIQKNKEITMKKALLLSVVASVAVMAGGDIAPVPAPVVEEVSGWDFSGQAVIYYQTGDKADGVDLFDQAGAMADFGLQLRAENKDVFAGIGFGGEVSGLATLNLENWMVSNTMQGVGAERGDLIDDIDEVTDGGWISQLYITYGFGNTSIKAGRQELPKSLSPFAFSEHWNVFANTFDSVLVVNTDITDTTLVGAWVYGGNINGVPAATVDALGNLVVKNSMSDFNSFNDDDGIWMLTVQNKSIDSLTLTGTWYYAPDMAVTEDINILWGDATYAAESFTVAGQIGSVMSDAFVNDTVAWGLKVGGSIDMFDLSLAYTGVDDGDTGVFNVGGVKTPLYTQMILNQGAIRSDNDTIVARAGVKALGGKFGLAYDYTTDNSVLEADYQEFDLTYKTKVFNGSTTLFAGYIYQNQDDDVLSAADTSWDQNVLRFWGRYNF